MQLATFLCILCGKQVVHAVCRLSATSASSAGEYSHTRTQSICKEEPSMSLADLADLRRRTTITTNMKHLQINAALLHSLRNLRHQRYQKKFF